MIEHKKCTICKEIKPISEFGKDSKSKDGLKGQCKKCKNKAHIEYQKKNRKRLNTYLKEYWRKYYYTDKQKQYRKSPKFKEVHYKSQQKYYRKKILENPEYWREKDRKKRAKAKEKKMNELFESTIYMKSSDNKYRYALGKKGKNTLYCFGINPSTATPEKYDPTITRVSRVAKKSGFDSFVMLNIYPQRATDPADLDKEVNSEQHEQNMSAVNMIQDGSYVWAAWGDLIKARPYLKDCLIQIQYLLQTHKKDIHWVKMGELTKNGNPRHPLYLKYQPFSEYRI
jgi:hypothetical protein